MSVCEFFHRNTYLYNVEIIVLIVEVNEWNVYVASPWSQSAGEHYLQMLFGARNEASLLPGLRIINQTMKTAIFSRDRKGRPETISSHRHIPEKIMKQKPHSWNG